MQVKNIEQASTPRYAIKGNEESTVDKLEDKKRTNITSMVAQGVGQDSGLQYLWLRVM